MSVHSTLQAALHYAGRGWPVFPVSFSKVPFKGSHGFLDATTDTAQLNALWARRKRANVALATGRIVVFDCDGDAGLHRFLALGLGPKTLVARTPRGGWHFYYLAPEGVTIRSKAEARRGGSQGQRDHSGLDIRGAGGFVLLPPSITKDGAYQWAHEHPIAPLPNHLAAFAASIGARPPNQTAKPIAVPDHLIAARLSGGPSIMQAMTAGLTPDLSEHERARVWSALNAIGKSISYDDFLKIGFSLHSLNWVRSDGTDAGFELWDQWAAQFPDTYNLDGLEKKWQSFGRNEYPNKTITIGTLFNLAREAGWGGDVVAPPQAALSGTGSPPGTMPPTPGAPSPGVSGASSLAQSPNVLPPSGGVPGLNGAPANLALPAAFVASAIVFPDTDTRGRPKLTCVNAIKAIEGLGLSCQFDNFHQKMLIGGQPIEAWAGDLSDHTVAMLRRIIWQKYSFDPGERNTRDAAVACCLEHAYNPVTNYLDSLQWDHEARIDRWTVNYLGAPDTPLYRSFGKLMLIAAVRRARNPGCKFDQIIVLEGPQGIGKSSAVRILAGPENYSDQHILGASDREQQEAFQGVWLHEIAELAGMRRADIERIKHFARRTEDRARPAYAHFRMDVKRRGIFVATTNEQTYLKEWDRAFWPIACGTIALAQLQGDRDQLWAEAAYHEALETSLELPEALRPHAAEHIAERQETDTWEDGVVAALRGASETSINDILMSQTFHLSYNEISQANQNRVARILKKLGFEKYRSRQGEERAWRYRKVGPVGTLGTKKV